MAIRGGGNIPDTIHGLAGIGIKNNCRTYTINNNTITILLNFAESTANFSKRRH